MKSVAILPLIGAAILSFPTSAKDVSAYSGLCDASAAAVVGAAHFVVADDESNVLRIYRRGKESPVSEVDLSEFLGATGDDETDIEGAAGIGNRTFWISSHGANKNGKERPSRRKFFATEAKDGSTPSVAPIGMRYDDLLKDMLMTPSLKKYGLDAASKRPPKSEGGLSIEGLAATGRRTLLIGFRNPVPGKTALIVPLENPNDVILGKSAIFGSPIELDLGGLGIRSLEWVGSDYYIVAGAFGEGKEFAIYKWSGSATAMPKRMTKPDLTGLNPEALFLNQEKMLQLLSDDGSETRDGTHCKDLKKGQQSFRSISVQLNSIK
jgi:hypothetical protein